MKKDLSVYPNVSVRKKYTFKTITFKVIKFLFLLFCVFVYIIMLSPLFNLEIFKHKQYEFCTEYFVVYTTPDNNTKESAMELSQNLHARGAGGNVVLLGKQYVVVVSQCKTDGDAKKIVANLDAQNIASKSFALNVEIDCHGLNEEERKILQTLYATNTSTINSILEFATDLDKNNTSNLDVSIEIFSLYTTYENLSLKYENVENAKIKEYLNRMQKIQSLLYLLSQEDRVSSNLVSYVSQIRNYVYRIMEILS